MSLDQLKEKMNSFPIDNKGSRSYSQEFKEKVLDYHYINNMPILSIGRILGINGGLISKWKTKYGKERTSYRHGAGLRYDVRTKCLAVQRHIEEGCSLSFLAKEYGCNQSAIHQWKVKYMNIYTQYLSLPDGIPYVVEEHRHVYGNKNIDKVLALLAKQEQELDDQLSVVRSKKESIKAAVTLLQEAGLKVA